MVTVFTPVYNRAYIIQQLYDSLCRQTSKDFEWLIVDDGSTDNTETLVRQWIEDGIIKIRYIRQENMGKHVAINNGLSVAKGELFFIVDSDDRLTPDAVAWVLETSRPIISDDSFAGVSGIRIYPDGNKIGGECDFVTIDANAIDIRYKYNVKGDLAEVFKTKVLMQYLFPVFEGERFCPEALVWHRIACKYKMRYVNYGIYICDYLSDGLTANIVKIRHNSPLASMTYYSELYHLAVPRFQKIKAAINFHRFSPGLFPRGFKMVNPISMLAILPGKLMRLHDKKKCDL